MSWEELTEQQRRRLLFTPCTSKDALHRWIKRFLGLDLPDTKVDPASTSTPMDLVWEIYDRCMRNQPGEFSRILAYASRECYKTMVAAILEVLAICHMERGIVHLAAIKPQSYKAMSYVRDFFNKPLLRDFVDVDNDYNKTFVRYVDRVAGEFITAREFEKLHKSKPGPGVLERYTERKFAITIATATLQGTNSSHEPFVVLDEVDVFDNAKIYEEAKGIPSPFEGKLPVTLLTSTRKSRFGPVQKEIDQCEKTGLRVRHWNIIDCAEACPAERHRPDLPKETIYYSEDTLETVTAEEYATYSDERKIKFKADQAHPGCVKNCKIFAACRGRLQHQKQDNPNATVRSMLKPIHHVQEQFRGGDLDWVKAQLLCWKPGTTGVIYPYFEPEIHFVGAAQIAEMVTGQAQPADMRKDQLIQLLKTRTNVRFRAGIDWGYSHHFSVDQETILVPCGQKPKKIKDFSPGDSILGVDDLGVTTKVEVVGVYDHGLLEGFEVEFDDGYSLVCSADHKFLTEQGQVPIRFIAASGLEVLCDASQGGWMDEHVRSGLPEAPSDAGAPSGMCDVLRFGCHQESRRPTEVEERESRDGSSLRAVREGCGRSVEGKQPRGSQSGRSQSADSTSSLEGKVSGRGGRSVSEGGAYPESVGERAPEGKRSCQAKVRRAPEGVGEDSPPSGARKHDEGVPNPRRLKDGGVAPLVGHPDLAGGADPVRDRSIGQIVEAGGFRLPGPQDLGGGGRVLALLSGEEGQEGASGRIGDSANSGRDAERRSSSSRGCHVGSDSDDVFWAQPRPQADLGPLAYSDAPLTSTGGLVRRRVVRVRPVGLRRMYDLEVAHPKHNFLLPNGVVTSNSTVLGAVDGPRCFVLECITVAELETAQQIELCKARLMHYGAKIHADAEDPQSIRSFKKAGFRIAPVLKGPGSVVGGINVIRTMLRPAIGKPAIYFLKDDPEGGMQSLQTSLSTYHWKMDVAGNPTDQPADEGADACDALRYLIKGTFGKYGKLTASKDAPVPDSVQAIMTQRTQQRSAHDQIRNLIAIQTGVVLGGSSGPQQPTGEIRKGSFTVDW